MAPELVDAHVTAEQKPTLGGQRGVTATQEDLVACFPAVVRIVERERLQEYDEQPAAALAGES